MPCSEVVLGLKYRHDETGNVMKIESASVPALDNQVTLTSEDCFGLQGIFCRIWRGSWDDFLQQWSVYNENSSHRIAGQEELVLS